jgi:hypothetical protein
MRTLQNQLDEEAGNKEINAKLIMRIQLNSSQSAAAKPVKEAVIVDVGGHSASGFVSQSAKKKREQEDYGVGPATATINVPEPPFSHGLPVSMKKGIRNVCNANMGGQMGAVDSKGTPITCNKSPAECLYAHVGIKSMTAEEAKRNILKLGAKELRECLLKQLAVSARKFKN